MFGTTEYLRWADSRLGTAIFDLGRSGVFGSNQPLLDPLDALNSSCAWEELRANIARYNGVNCNEVLATLGTSHALWVAYTALLSPGDEVLAESVTYEPIYRVAEGIGAKVSLFERSPSIGFALDPTRVAYAINKRTRVVVITNLHNPSGIRADEEAIRDIASIAAANGAYLVIDEVYAPFDCLCDIRGVWGKSSRNIAPNIIAVGSLTKCYGLGPHRIGWMLGPPDIVVRGCDVLVANLGSLPSPWMATCIQAFRGLPAIAEWSRTKCAGKRARVDAWFMTRPHLAWSEPNEGVFGMAIDTRTDEDLTECLEKGIREHGVIVVPGKFFGVPNAFRLAWTIEETKLDEALCRLGHILD